MLKAGRDDKGIERKNNRLITRKSMLKVNLYQTDHVVILLNVKNKQRNKQEQTNKQTNKQNKTK